MTAEKRPPAACLIGWPAAHSRSPLIHHYWLRTLGIEGGYSHRGRCRPRGCRIRAPSFDCTASPAPTSPSRTRSARWRCRSRTRARWPSARPIRCGTRAANLRSTNTDIEGFINNLDACAPGWDTRRGCPGARGRRLVARGGVRAARARHQARAPGQPHPRAGARAGRTVRRPRSSGRVGNHRRRVAARGPAGEHHVARHARPAGAADRLSPAAGPTPWSPTRLCAAANAAAGRGARSAG